MELIERHNITGIDAKCKTRTLVFLGIIQSVFDSKRMANRLTMNDSGVQGSEQVDRNATNDNRQIEGVRDPFPGPEFHLINQEKHNGSNCKVLFDFSFDN